MNDNIFFLAGIEKCEREQFAEAIVSFSACLKEHPKHLPSFFNRGLAKLKLADYQGAILDFDMVITLDVRMADAWSERGLAKHLLGKSEEAIKDFDMAVELEPNKSYRYSSRAFIKAKIGDVFGASEDYQKAIYLDPSDAVAYNNLGILEESMGLKKSAQERYTKADELTGKEIFQKPDVEQLIKEHQAKKENGATTPTIQLSQQIKKNAEKQAVNNENTIHNFQQTENQETLFGVIKKVFTSKETFHEFLTFSKEKLGFKVRK